MTTISREALTEAQRNALRIIERFKGEKAQRYSDGPEYLRGYYYLKSDGDVMCHFADDNIILNRDGEMMLTIPKMFAPARR